MFLSLIHIFALTQIIPVEKAVEYLKAEVKKNYGHQGQKVIDMNFDAIEEALKHIHKVDLRLLCRESGEERKQEICTGDADTDFFVNNIMVPMNRQKGDNLPVSCLLYTSFLLRRQVHFWMP